MKVLVTEKIAREGLDRLAEAGYEVIQGELTQETIVDCDALIVRSGTKVTAAAIKAADKLKIIGRAGTGSDNVDVKAATEKGIVVKISPDGNINAVAELIFGLMIALSRNVFQSRDCLRGGIWRKEQYKGIELYGKTLGIIGCGRIGKRVAEIAVNGFRMKVIGCDIVPIDFPLINFVDLDTLLNRADYVTLHLPKEKSPLIGSLELEKMKKTAFLINASRGGNVDEEALYQALKDRRIAGAGFDVWEQEGKEGQSFKNQLCELDNLIGIPHLGASTREAQEMTGVEIADVVVGYLKRGSWVNSENYIGGETVSRKDGPTNNLFVLHRNVPGMFSKLSGIFGNHGINLDSLSTGTSKDRSMQITVFRAEEKIIVKLIEEIRSLDGVERAIT